MNGKTYFAIGLVLVLLGIQLRAVDTYVLNEKTTQFLEKRMQSSSIISENTLNASLYTMAVPTVRKQLTHPRWVGLAFISAGAVLLLHGLSQRGQ
jgi:hypothetical protein